LNTRQFFKTHVFTCTCEISYGRGNRTQKPKRLSPTTYGWAIRKYYSADLFSNYCVAGCKDGIEWWRYL